jgi:hypothetical protein
MFLQKFCAANKLSRQFADKPNDRIWRQCFMDSTNNLDQIATSIATLGKEDVKDRLKNFKGRFRLDFTDEYLDSLSIDRLRHILLAALLTAKAHN